MWTTESKYVKLGHHFHILPTPRKENERFCLLLNPICFVCFFYYWQVDESLKAEDVEVYYDPAELFSGLLKGSTIPETHADTATSAHGCPFRK